MLSISANHSPCPCLTFPSSLNITVTFTWNYLLSALCVCNYKLISGICFAPSLGSSLCVFL